METRKRSSDFVNHSCDYRPNRTRTPLCSITIINLVKGNQKKNCSDIRPKFMVFDNHKMEFNPSLLDVICTLDIVDPRSVQERDHM